MKRVAGASQPSPAELGQVDAGQDADRRADQRGAAPTIMTEPTMALSSPPVTARRRRHLR